MPVRGFARQAPSKNNKKRLVDIRVTNMNARDATWWDSRFGVKHLAISSRADRYWIWSVMLPMCHLVQHAKRRYCRPLVIWARTDRGRFLRVAMSILIEFYPYLDVERDEGSHFMWFMSAADAKTLESEFEMSHPPALGQVLIDNSIVLSQNAGLGGRIGLHSARAGGPGLLALYAHLGLLRLPESANLPAAIRRKNDGRFFYANEACAEVLAAKLDPHR